MICSGSGEVRADDAMDGSWEILVWIDQGVEART